MLVPAPERARMDALTAWLQRIGLERYAPVFLDNGVELDSLPLLSESDLEKLGVLLGHRRKLLQAVVELRNRETSPKTGHRSLIADGERRQLTVLFCDLVGSTERAHRLDPEELGALMRRYRAACTEAVTRYEGNVTQHLGDGVMVTLPS